MTQVGDTWYRIEDRLYANASWGFDDEPTGSHIKLMTVCFTVVKLTPCGVRLDNGRFVNVNHTKEFACPTIEEAKKSFLARKKRQVSIYEARAKKAREAIALLDEKA